MSPSLARSRACARLRGMAALEAVRGSGGKEPPRPRGAFRSSPEITLWPCLPGQPHCPHSGPEPPSLLQPGSSWSVPVTSRQHKHRGQGGKSEQTLKNKGEFVCLGSLAQTSHKSRVDCTETRNVYLEWLQAAGRNKKKPLFPQISHCSLAQVHIQLRSLCSQKINIVHRTRGIDLVL